MEPLVDLFKAAFRIAWPFYGLVAAMGYIGATNWLLLANYGQGLAVFAAATIAAVAAIVSYHYSRRDRSSNSID